MTIEQNCVRSQHTIEQDFVRGQHTLEKNVNTQFIMSTEIVVAESSIIAYQMNLSNKFVDVYFNNSIWGDDGETTAITATDLEIYDVIASGVTAVEILSIKKPDHHVSASATNLSGGESVVSIAD